MDVTGLCVRRPPDGRCRQGAAGTVAVAAACRAAAGTYRGAAAWRAAAGGSAATAADAVRRPVPADAAPDTADACPARLAVAAAPADARRAHRFAPRLRQPMAARRLESPDVPALSRPDAARPAGPDWLAAAASVRSAA